MTRTTKLNFFLTCLVPVACSAWAQNSPNGNPGDWADSDNYNPLVGQTTSPTGGPSNQGYTSLPNNFAGQDIGPVSNFGASGPTPNFYTYPYSGAFSQSISVYLNPTLASEQSGGVTIDETPNSTVNTPQYGTPQLWGAEEEFNLTGSAGGINVSLGNTAIANITSAGWYNFTMDFVPGATGTPVTVDLSIADQSNALLGSISTEATDQGAGTFLSENLEGSGYVWLTEWSDGFAGNSLDVADVDVAAVPDNSSTLALFGCAFGALAVIRRRFNRA